MRPVENILLYFMFVLLVANIPESLNREHLLTILNWRNQMEEKIASQDSDSVCPTKDSILYRTMELEQEEILETV